MNSALVGVLGIVLLALLLLFLVAMAWYFRFWLRRHHAQDQLTRLANHYFAGQPEVVLHLPGWKVTAADIRAVAAQRGYVEVAQPNPMIAVYRSAPATGLPLAPPSPPSRKQATKRERLSAELASKAFAWIELAEVGGTMDELAVFAGAHGATVSRAYGDRRDPTVLLSKVPITTVADTLRHARAPRLHSMARHWTGAGLTIGSFLVAGLALGAVQRFGWPTPVNIALFALPLGMLIFAVALPLRPAFGITTARMTRLIGEFDGRARVTVLTQQFALDRLVFGDVAAELGYSFLSSQNSWMTDSRWNKSRITFVKNYAHGPTHPKTAYNAWEGR